MNTILRPVLELTVMIPGLLLAYLPVQTYLKQPPGRLAAWLAPLLAGICLRQLPGIGILIQPQYLIFTGIKIYPV